MGQRAKADEYYNILKKKLKELVREDQKQYNSAEEFVNDHETVTDIERAFRPVPTEKLIGISGVPGGTVRNNGLFYKLEHDLAGVRYPYRKGRIVVHIPTFIEEEMGGWDNHGITCDGCGRDFKNRRGLNIHQGRTGCGDPEQGG